MLTKFHAKQETSVRVIVADFCTLSEERWPSLDIQEIGVEKGGAIGKVAVCHIGKAIP